MVMTDNEIIKALECCSNAVGEKCKECPINKNCLEVELNKEALDLINRQKAEIKELVGKIDRLKEENKKLKNEMSYMTSPNRIGDRHEMGGW